MKKDIHIVTSKTDSNIYGAFSSRGKANDFISDRTDGDNLMVMRFIYETDEKEESDSVNNPSHYTDGKIEVIDFIEDKNLDFHLGNAIKYICRAGKKDKLKEVEDLKKSIWYINRKIKNLEDLKW